MRAEVKLTGWNDSEENKQELLWGSDWAKLDGLDADLLSHNRHFETYSSEALYFFLVNCFNSLNLSYDFFLT